MSLFILAGVYNQEGTALKQVRNTALVSSLVMTACLH